MASFLAAPAAVGLNETHDAFTGAAVSYLIIDIVELPYHQATHAYDVSDHVYPDWDLARLGYGHGLRHPVPVESLATVYQNIDHRGEG